MIKNILFLGLTVLILSGCAATMSQTDVGPYAPKTDVPPSGTVAYNPDGIPELVQSRRQDALKKIYDVCLSNDYKIIHEEVKPTPKSNGALANFGASRLNYMDFQCGAARPKIKAPSVSP